MPGVFSLELLEEEPSDEAPSEDEEEEEDDELELLEELLEDEHEPVALTLTEGVLFAALESLVVEVTVAVFSICVQVDVDTFSRTFTITVLFLFSLPSALSVHRMVPVLFAQTAELLSVPFPSVAEMNVIPEGITSSISSASAS